MAHQKEGTNESTPLMSLQPGAEGPIHTEPGGREDAGGTADAASSRGRGGEGDESEEWERRWESHSGGMERIHEEASQNPPRLSVPNRVNQLEAAELDKELIDMLFVQLNRVFALFRPSLLEAFQPELEAAFRSTVFYFSIWSGGQTPGNYFQNLVFVDGRSLHAGSLKGAPPSLSQRRLHALLFVLLPWLWARGSRFLSAREWGARPAGDVRRRVWKAVQWLETVHRCATTLNLLLFLRFGRYRSVGERVLRLRLLPKEPTLSRSLNFDYMNQVLLWNSFQELFETLRPLLVANAHRFTRLLLALPSPLSILPPSLSSASAPPPDGTPLPISACGICHVDPPHTPHHGSCSHPFCYYCLRSALVSNPRGFACPRCHVLLSTCQRAAFQATREGAREESGKPESEGGESLPQA